MSPTSYQTALPRNRELSIRHRPKPSISAPAGDEASPGRRWQQNTLRAPSSRQGAGFDTSGTATVGLKPLFATRLGFGVWAMSSAVNHRGMSGPQSAVSACRRRLSDAMVI